jgi:hypothetical protein
VLKKTWNTVFGLEVVGRLVVNAFYVKLTKNQVRISLKRTFMYFPPFFILPPPPLFLKAKKKLHSMVKWLFFIIKHPNTSLYLFVIDFTILDRLRTFRIF